MHSYSKNQETLVSILYSIRTMFAFWFLTLATFVHGQTAENIQNLQNVSSTLTVSAITSGVLCIVFGIFMLFFGYRLLKPLLFLGGFFVFTLIGFAILTKLEPAGGYSNPDAVLFWGSLAIGVLGGILSLVLFQFGITMLGALAGFCLAVFILSLKSGGLIASQGGRIGLMAGLSLAGAIIIHFFERPLIIIFSSMGGAYSIVYGIDTFTKVGYVATLRAYSNSGFKASEVYYTITWQVAVLLATTILLAIIGSIVQFRLNRGRDHRYTQSSSKSEKS